MRIPKTGFCTRAILCFFGAALLGSSFSAQITTKRVATGFSRPMKVGAPEGDPRLFVALKGGQIRVIKAGALLPTPFLNISSKISNGSEQGLLGMAFHPDYENNGYIFVSYTDNTGGDSVVARYTQDATNPDIADVSSEVIVIEYNQPFSNHNAGEIAFGPMDGYLYIATGDGGSGNDPACRAQNLNVYLGKILRIDVDPLPYSIPPDNPLVGTPGIKEEVFHWGLRNPFRFSFDRLTGDMYIGDVGQNAREEISFAAHGESGVNFGWKIMEANRCNSTSNCAGGTPGCFNPAYRAPIHEIFQGPAFSVIGGYVYRGNLMPGEYGRYFFTDYYDDIIRSTDPYSGTGTLQNIQNRTSELAPGGGLFIRNIAGFGEDGFGELYLVDDTSGVNGEVFKIVPVGAAQANAVIDNGSGINTIAYTPTSMPIIGNAYEAEVDVSTHPGGATFSFIFGFTGTNNLPTAIGELFISGTSVFSFAEASGGGIDEFSNVVPVVLSVNGMQVQSQAFSIGAGTTVAYNAVTLTAGMY